MFSVLEPAGLIALNERALIFHSVLLMLIVIVPVYLLAFCFAWWYRAGNTKAVYSPNWEHAKLDELIWWAIPFEIVLVLAALTWTSTHDLDPHKALSSVGGQAPLIIQVVALDWKWLFIYPEQHIATVNYVQFPVGRPVEFQITADAPMNSFWIPELGGQIYAMTGMVTTLHLIADKEGSFAGSSANYSGDGFAQMKFTANATSQTDFDAWVRETKQSAHVLNMDTYKELSQPNVINHVDTYADMYGSIEQNLFNTIVMKFMPASPEKSSQGGPANAMQMDHH